MNTTGEVVPCLDYLHAFTNKLYTHPLTLRSNISIIFTKSELSASYMENTH